MGDRVQVHIKDTGVYLYSHYDGSEIEEIVQRAMVKKWRWDDPEYLGRIVFEEMIKESLGTETGYGISTKTAGEKLLTIDCENSRITSQGKKWTFEEFIKHKFQKKDEGEE